MALPAALIMSAFELVPDFVRYFKGDKKADVAEKVVDVAKVLTGQDDPAAALDAVKKDPELMAKLKDQAKEIALAELAAETAQQAQVNETMRAGLVSNSMFKSGWRPAFGWSMVPLFALFVVGMVLVPIYLVVTNPVRAAAVMTALVDYLGVMMWIWGAAFAVLGVNISKRSQDKQVAAGMLPTVGGILGALRRS